MEQVRIPNSELKLDAKSISSFLFPRKSDHPIHRSFIHWIILSGIELSNHMEYRKVKIINDLRQEIRKAIDINKFGRLLMLSYEECNVSINVRVNLLLMNIIDFSSTHLLLRESHFVTFLFFFFIDKLNFYKMLKNFWITRVTI